MWRRKMALEERYEIDEPDKELGPSTMGSVLRKVTKIRTGVKYALKTFEVGEGTILVAKTLVEMSSVGATTMRTRCGGEVQYLRRIRTMSLSASPSIPNRMI